MACNARAGLPTKCRRAFAVSSTAARCTSQSRSTACPTDRETCIERPVCVMRTGRFFVSCVRVRPRFIARNVSTKQCVVRQLALPIPSESDGMMQSALVLSTEKMAEEGVEYGALSHRFRASNVCTETVVSCVDKYEQFLKASALHAVKGLSAASNKRRDESAPGALANQG